MAQVLAAVVVSKGLDPVLVAVELALESGNISGDYVLNVLDRLSHHCHIVETGNESWRFRHSLASGNSKRRKSTTTQPDAGESEPETTDSSTDTQVYRAPIIRVRIGRKPWVSLKRQTTEVDAQHAFDADGPPAGA